MRAMVLDRADAPLRLDEHREIARPGPKEVRIRVRACGVCRTDLHLLDGDLLLPVLPLIPGHEIVGTVEMAGAEVTRFHEGDRVGVPWLGWTCGECTFCRSGRENLCDRARFTGFQLNGGFAELALADERYVFPIPTTFEDVAAAPLLCAGMIGFRALRLAGEASHIGLYGFGGSAHIATQIARQRHQDVYAFTRPGDTEGQKFAKSLGATWAGGSDEHPPVPLDAAVIFAPVGPLLPHALAATSKGGTVVCAGIHMTDIPSFPYRLLWGERIVRSVANLTRHDGEEFLAAALAAGVRTTTTSYPLANANEALVDLREGRVKGAAVLVP
jgi:alcohol dehydrogenase, propanol-preferring